MGRLIHTLLNCVWDSLQYSTLWIRSIGSMLFVIGGRLLTFFALTSFGTSIYNLLLIAIVAYYSTIWHYYWSHRGRDCFKGSCTDPLCLCASLAALLYGMKRVFYTVVWYDMPFTRKCDLPMIQWKAFCAPWTGVVFLWIIPSINTCLKFVVTVWLVAQFP